MERHMRLFEGNLNGRRIEVPARNSEKLLAAVEKGDLEVAARILEESDRMNPVSVTMVLQNAAILRAAVASGDPSMVALILEYKPNFGMYCLMGLVRDAVREQAPSEIVELLVQYGMNAHQFLGLHFSNLLHAAVERDNEEVVDILLDYGVDVNTRGLTGASALCHAVSLGRTSVARHLVERGARIDLRNNEHSSVLHVAAAIVSHELVTYFLDLGVDITARNYRGKTVLHFIAEAQCEDLDLAEELIRRGAPVNAQDELLLTPLHLAIMGKKTQLVRMLIQHGADLNAKTKTTVFPLYLAVEYSCPQTVELLLSKGARVNEETSQGLTSLHIACKNGSRKKIDILLRYGADVNAKNEIVNTPLYWVDNRSRTAKIALAKQVARLQSLGETVCEENFIIIRVYAEWQALYEKCLEELESLKREKIYGRYTYYHFLTASDLKLLPLLRNEDFVAAITAKSFAQLNFALYAPDLERKYARLEAKRVRIAAKGAHLWEIFGDYLPDVAIERILFHSAIDIYMS